MAWTINNGKLYFNTKLYTGDGNNARGITGVGFEPDWVWIKRRSADAYHFLTDTVRGATKTIYSNRTDAEATQALALQSFNTDGFTIGSNADVNGNTQTFASWNWLAAGTAPSNTYIVKVVSDSGNKYRFDDFGTSAVTLELSEGGTFTFDQSDSSNNGHPLRFATQANGANSSQYTTGVTTNGTPGQAGAYTRITVAASAPTLFYYCTSHSGMGGQANTPTTNSFSNFAGSIQSNISPNTTSGFSIVKYTGTGSAGATVGHGLGVTPKMIITKQLTSSSSWGVYHVKTGNTVGLILNETGSGNTLSAYWNNTSPTSSVFSIGTDGVCNVNGQDFIAYCFAEKQGYSKFSSYVGNGNADGTFVYTGFKPAFVIYKNTTQADSWFIHDNKRQGYNPENELLFADLSNAESTVNRIDLFSNGFKATDSDKGVNASGNNYIYMAFAENPFTSSAGTPVTAR